ncbi:MAG: SRPBCC family protein [Gemmataceae bacterium]
MSEARSSAPKKPRRWVGVPLLLLLLVGAAYGYLFVRGTWADPVPRDPATAEQGPVTQLFRDEQGRATVRSVVLLNHPREKVWALVTDYGRYGDLLPYVRGITATPGDGGTVVAGKAASGFTGYWDFAMTVREEKAGAWSAAWDAAPSDEVRVNRGRWTLTEQGPGQTLLELRLDAEARGYPRFLLRNFFLYRLGRVLEAVGGHLDGAGEP